MTYCVLSVNAADVIEDGRPSPLMTSCHSFLLITSTSPPRAMTRLNSSYRSRTCFAMIGSLFIGVPEIKMEKILTLIIALNRNIFIKFVKEIRPTLFHRMFCFQCFMRTVPF